MDQAQCIRLANSLFELEKKLQQKEMAPGIQRSLDKMKGIIEEAGLLLLNPIGETFTETRTDVDATLTGTHKGPLTITDVLKPVIYVTNSGKNILVQRGVVLVG